MKDAGNTSTVGFRNISILVAVVTLALCVSCYSHDEEYTDGKVTLYPVIGTSIQPIIETRATVTVNNAPGTYSDSYLSNGTDIRVFAVPVPTESTTPEEFDELKAGGLFRFYNDQWHSSVAVTANNDYRIFAFAASAVHNDSDPLSGWLLPGASNQTFNWGLSGDTYSSQNFNMDNVAINFSNMDVLTTVDPLVCIASSFQKYDAQDPQASEPATTPALTKGTFQIARTETTGGGSDILFKVWMALDHLLAKATVSFCVDNDYASIRDIRLKEAKIVIDKSQRSFRGNHSYSFKDGFIVDENSTFGISQENENDLEITLLGIDGENRIGPFDEDADYSTLTTTYKEFPSFFFLPMSYIPLGSLEAPAPKYPDVKLKVIYDVYKKDPDKETPVRLNQVAENSFPLSSFKIGAGDPVTPKAGDHFRIKVKVKPTYLYQLHDDDGQIELSIE